MLLDAQVDGLSHQRCARDLRAFLMITRITRDKRDCGILFNCILVIFLDSLISQDLIILIRVVDKNVHYASNFDKEK